MRETLSICYVIHICFLIFICLSFARFDINSMEGSLLTVEICKHHLLSKILEIIPRSQTFYMERHDWHTHCLCSYARLPTYIFTSEHVYLRYAQLSIIIAVPHTVQSLLAHDLRFWACAFRCHIVRISPPAAAVVVVVVMVVMKHCFGQGRRVGGEEGADELNTPSQLETKERPAKGPIAESWLTPHCMSHTHIHAQIQSLIDPLHCLIFFLSHPSPFPASSVVFVLTWASFLFFFHSFLCTMLCLLTYFLWHSTLDVHECTVSKQVVSLEGSPFQNLLSSAVTDCHSGKDTCAINRLSSLCKSDVISSCRASCYECRMS